MIILKTEKDIQKLKKWDMYLVQEVLDILKKNETNTDLYSVHEQINKVQLKREELVNNYIKKLDESSIKWVVTNKEQKVLDKLSK